MGIVSINKKLKPFATVKDKRYYVAHGGRGSAKSWSIARILLLFAIEKKVRILCTREIQDSIKDSVHKLLKDQIDLLGLQGFIVQNDTIKHENGSEFIFTGLYRNTTKLKSMEAIDYCWIEEAESISAQSWEVLDPTIRKPDSKIFISFNPRYVDDIIYSTFILNKPDNAIVIQVNWNDNKHFPKELEEQRIRMQRVNPELYLHIWEGQIKQNTEELIFSNKWVIDTFEADKYTHLYYGADWGFSQDPNTMNRMYIGAHPDYGNNCLFIEYELNDRPYNQEAKNTSTDLKDLPTFWDRMPNVKDYVITADSARPETISYMQQNGFNVKGAIKGANSVEDGIEFLKSFDKIIVHERCINTIYEFGNYKFKVDPRSGQITRMVVDKFNHHIDAIRYAMEECQSGGYVDWSLI